MPLVCWPSLLKMPLSDVGATRNPANREIRLCVGDAHDVSVGRVSEAAHVWIERAERAKSVRRIGGRRARANMLADLQCCRVRKAGDLRDAGPWWSDEGVGKYRLCNNCMCLAPHIF